MVESKRKNSVSDISRHEADTGKSCHSRLGEQTTQRDGIMRKHGNLMLQASLYCWSIKKQGRKERVADSIRWTDRPAHI